MKLLLKEMERLAAGQLAAPVDVKHYTGLCRDLAVCAEKIRQLIFGFAAELQVTAAQVASVEEQIQDAVTQSDHLVSAFDALKANTASIEMVMEDSAQTVIAGEQALANTNRVFQSVRASSEGIKSMVVETTAKLDGLNQVISRIDDILDRIDKISTQSRLLSFNAAIEAARAGEHGRGFTVVAQEMKNLSDKSSQGVKETVRVTQFIKEEIGQTIATVSKGLEEYCGELARVTKEVEKSLEAYQNAMTKIVAESRTVQEKVGGYFRQVNAQLDLWGAALGSLRKTTSLLESLQSALTSAVGKVAHNGVTLAEIDEAVSTAIIDDLQGLTSMPEIRGLEPVMHQEVLSAFLAQHRTLEAIYSNRADGTFIYSEPPAGLANAKVRPWWQEAMAGRIYKSQVYISAITRQPCLTVAVPIPGTDGKPVGVLAADLCIK